MTRWALSQSHRGYFYVLYTVHTDYGYECRENDSPVGFDASVLDVVEIHLEPLVKSHIVAVRSSLPVAGDTRCNIQALQLVVIVVYNLSWQRRARTDDAHMANQNIEKLR